VYSTHPLAYMNTINRLVEQKPKTVTYLISRSRVERAFDSSSTPDFGPHLLVVLVHPRKNDPLSNAVDVTAQWVSIYIRQCKCRVWTRRVLELPRRYLGQH